MIASTFIGQISDEIQSKLTHATRSQNLRMLLAVQTYAGYSQSKLTHATRSQNFGILLAVKTYHILLFLIEPILTHHTIENWPYNIFPYLHLVISKVRIEGSCCLSEAPTIVDWFIHHLELVTSKSVPLQSIMAFEKSWEAMNPISCTPVPSKQCTPVSRSHVPWAKIYVTCTLEITHFNRNVWKLWRIPWLFSITQNAYCFYFQWSIETWYSMRKEVGEMYLINCVSNCENESKKVVDLFVSLMLHYI